MADRGTGHLDISAGPLAPDRVFGALDSTMAEAKRQAAQGAPHLTSIRAESQSAGRGRQGRPWVSAPGNLYWSLLLRPCPHWPQPATLSYVAALAVLDSLVPLIPPGMSLGLKWPNDVLIDGAKISGILLESAGMTGTRQTGHTDWIILGIGLNIAHHPEAELRYPATSLAALGGPPVAPAALAATLKQHVVALLAEWEKDGFPALRARVLAWLLGVGEEIRIRLTADPTRDRVGVLRDIDPEGCLVLEEASGTKRLAAGDLILPGDDSRGDSMSPLS